jgi:hypothetical protein
MSDINDMINYMTRDPALIAEADQAKSFASEVSAKLISDIAMMVWGKARSQSLPFLLGSAGFGDTVRGLTEEQAKTLAAFHALQLFQLVVQRVGGLDEFLRRIDNGQPMPCLSCGKDTCTGDEASAVNLEGLLNG